MGIVSLVVCPVIELFLPTFLLQLSSLPDCRHGLYQLGLQDRRSATTNTRRHQCFPPPETDQRQKVSIDIESSFHLLEMLKNVFSYKQHVALHLFFVLSNMMYDDDDDDDLFFCESALLFIHVL